MMNNGIKSMTNYANNYPPHINAIQQMVTQVIIIPYQHTTCHCFSQFFFSQALCASSHFFSHYAFDIHQHFVLLLFFFLGLWPHFILSLFRLSTSSSFFLLCSMLFQIIQQYKNNGNASICYGCMFPNWSRWKKRK